MCVTAVASVPLTCLLVLVSPSVSGTPAVSYVGVLLSVDIPYSVILIAVVSSQDSLLWLDYLPLTSL